MRQVAEVMTICAEKHKDRDYAHADRSWVDEFDAAIRHLVEWRVGEETDPETGRSHLAHAAARVLILLSFVLTGRGTDDRRN